MKSISGVYWDKGGRSLNQDSLILQQAATNRGRVVLVAVSDGIGGLQEGENASGYITEKLIENFYDHVILLVGRRKGKKAIKRNLLRCFCNINEELKKYGMSKDLELGATISLLLIWRRNYVIFHLGDSRIYRYHHGKIRLLTQDHSDRRKNLIKCMGSFPFQYPDISFGRLYGRSGFLLCTDGFYRFLDGELLRVLCPEEIDREEQIGKRLRELASAASKRGETDNMSAVYLILSGKEIA